MECPAGGGAGPIRGTREISYTFTGHLVTTVIESLSREPGDVRRRHVYDVRAPFTRR